MQGLKRQFKVAVVGAGMAGSACAHALTQAGHAVQVFDKSRGPGGRLATRSVHRGDGSGAAHVDHFDHGVAGFEANGVGFSAFVRAAEMAGQVLPWHPVVDPAGWPLDNGGLRYVPVPDMPQLCRPLLSGAQQHWHHTVQALHHSAAGWQLTINQQLHPACFDAVMLALPPAQAASFLGAHVREWAQRASLAVMQPCWTLMALADAPADRAVAWHWARPTRGPLALLMRADASPGRTRVLHQQAWVAHARPAWSREHLEQPAAWVQAQLQAAVADWLGHTPIWSFASVHRWRYAMPRAVPNPQSSRCWWNDRLGLGVCGDFLGGQGTNGVEGAWMSGNDLARSFLAPPDKPIAPNPVTASGRSRLHESAPPSMATMS
jgi:renalase